MALVEVCVGSVNSALAALEGGAQRIEMCDNLMEGGTTPSYGTLMVVRRLLNIPIHAIIRPRGGDFVYSNEEFDAVLHDIRMCKDMKIDGVVVGFLKPNGEIDCDQVSAVQSETGSLSITFHRAFDMTPEPNSALDTLVDLGIDRVLTSGQKNSAIEGRDLIKELVDRAAGRIVVMAGAGLNHENVAEFARFTKATEYHGTMQSKVTSEMNYQKTGIAMGENNDLSEFERFETDPLKVSKFVDSLKNL